VEGFVAGLVLAGEELFAAGVVDVAGFEGVWALAANVAAATTRARTNRFMRRQLPGWILERFRKYCVRSKRRSGSSLLEVATTWVS
jgi:hypothetical protein